VGTVADVMFRVAQRNGGTHGALLLFARALIAVLTPCLSSTSIRLTGPPALAHCRDDAHRAGIRCPQKISGHRNRRNVSPYASRGWAPVFEGVPHGVLGAGRVRAQREHRAAVHLWACPFGPIVQCSFSSP
jgi:hypothetical protein